MPFQSCPWDGYPKQETQDGSEVLPAGAMHRAKKRRLVAMVTGPAIFWRAERAAQGSLLAGRRRTAGMRALDLPSGPFQAARRKHRFI